MQDFQWKDDFLFQTNADFIIKLSAYTFICMECNDIAFSAGNAQLFNQCTMHKIMSFHNNNGAARKTLLYFLCHQYEMTH